MALNGWVKAHRQMLDHWVSQEPEMFACWMRLLLEANHSETKRMFNGTLTTVKRGQLVFGLEAFSHKSGISVKKLRRYLELLEEEGMIGRQKTSKYSLISIVNYEEYQPKGSQEAGEGQAEGKQRASKGQHRENGKNVENVKKPPKPPKGDEAPLDEIIDLYHRILPELPQAANYTDTRVKQLKARWSETATVPAGNGEFEKMPCSSMEFWERYFRRVRNCPLLLGEKNGWHASLDWLTKKQNFYKVIEGNYLE